MAQHAPHGWDLCPVAQSPCQRIIASARRDRRQVRPGFGVEPEHKPVVIFHRRAPVTGFKIQVLRIDPFVFYHPDAKPEDDYFKQYWELLKGFGARFHWGKTLSDPGSSTGAAYRRQQCGPAEWDAFMALRSAWDPDEIFLTHYWRAHLGI